VERITPESREFLLTLFTDLREDLAHQAGSEALPGKRVIYDALLSGLADDAEGFAEEETVREYVVGLAKATDEANQYEQAVLEHRAFAELARALGGNSPTEPGTGAVDWDALLARLPHPTQCQIIEAMHWIGRPISASQLAHVFDNREDLATVSYHLRRLRDLRIVRLKEVRQVRGAKERLYTLVTVLAGEG
jgi:DNA-binding transcriptional ArsR family regulator